MRLLTAALVAPAITAVFLEHADHYHSPAFSEEQFFTNIQEGQSMHDNDHVNFFFNEIFDFDAIVQANLNTKIKKPERRTPEPEIIEVPDRPKKR